MLGRRCAVINLPRYGKLNHYLEAGSKLRRCMHRAISLSLSLSLSSPYIPPPLFAFFHCSPHFTLFTSIPPPCLFFPSFLLSVLMRLFQNVQLSPLSCYVFCRMYPFSSRSFASIQYYSYAFLFSPFSLHYCNHSTITPRVFLFFFTLPSELLQPTLSSARCLPMFTFLLLLSFLLLLQTFLFSSHPFPF